MKIEKRWISSDALFSAIGELLAQHRQAAFTVTGMSMWPFLCHGRDEVIVEACDWNTLKKGDIVLLQTARGNYLLHRVTKIKGEQFETTGDGNCFRDGWFEATCLRARVISVVRKGKKISCYHIWWKCAGWIWSHLFFMRKWLLKLLPMIASWKRTIS